MNTLSRSLEIFRDLLNSSWISIEELQDLVGSRAYLADWLQGNWENVVEGAVTHQREFDGATIYLEVYGEGADYHPSSSRLLNPTVQATHAVHCRPLTGKVLYDQVNETVIDCPPDGIPLEEFVSFSSGWYERCPPFDYILLQPASEDRVVKVEEVDFMLHRVSGG